MHETSSAGRRMRRLLLATDRSAASRAALLAVAGLAAGGETQVVVLHVDDRGAPDAGWKLVADIACGLVALAVDARPEVRQAPRGQVAGEIAAAAAEHDAQLVVMGSRGRSDLGGLLLGSVSHEVIEQVRCPVLLARDGRGASGRRRRVLVAVAGDEDLGELIGITAAVAEPDARVLVLHLLAPGDGDLQLAASGQMVDLLVAGLRRYGVRASGRVRAGVRDTGVEIARTAHDYGADLIVVGSRRLPTLAALLHGSVSHQVFHHSEGPVLVSAGNGGRSQGHERR